MIHYTGDDPHRSELAYTISNGKSDESSGHERLVIIQLPETCNEVTARLCMCAEGDNQITCMSWVPGKDTNKHAKIKKGTVPLQS